MAELIAQLAIGIVGITALVLLIFEFRIASILGLMTQPFWFYTSVKHNQWGVFALTIGYTLVWFIALWRDYFQKNNFDNDLQRMSKEEIKKEIMRLRDGIRLHRDEKGNDRCWLDDDRLYMLLPEQKHAETALPPKFEFLVNCEKYHALRQKPSEVH